MNTTLPIGWLRDGQHLQRSDKFPTFRDALHFVNAVAAVAEQQDHHPDMLLTYRHCSVRWRSHDVGGISPRDLRCAALVDALAAPEHAGSAIG